jgi:bifunctional DNA-binding transcriptional regulator/antitoxin component of YhaV-PrlF toxin-antitoxin module
LNPERIIIKWRKTKMTLIRAFSRMDKEGKIKLPGNIQRATGLKEGQLVELKVTGTSSKKSILVTSREAVR